MHLTIVATNLRRLAIALWVVAAVLIPVGFLSSDSWWLVPVPSIFIAFFAWSVLWRPRVETTDTELVVVDVRRTSRYAWRRVQDIRTTYGLEVVTDQGERRTWIAPRPNARLTVRHTSGSARPGGPVHVTLDAAAAELRTLVPAPVVPDGAPPTTVVAAPIVHRIHGWTVVALIVLGLLASMAGARL